MSTLTPTHDENLSPNTKSILGFLGIHITYSEFVELYNDIKSHPPQELWEVAAREIKRTRKHSPGQLNETTRDLVKADLLLAIDILSSHRSSQTTTSSIFSRDATESYASSTSAAPHAGYQSQPAAPDHRRQALTSLSQTLQDEDDLFLPKEASPYIHTAPFNSAKHYCLACQKCYTDHAGLKKHRKEKCESTVYWLCLHCLHSSTPRWIMFGREYRLRDHHNKEHVGWPGLDMKKATRSYPPQKAWGCPCCQACFNSREEWYIHEKQHKHAVHWEGKNGHVVIHGWSRKTVFESLLLNWNSPSDVASSYDWQNWNWQQGSDAWQRVKFVFERYELHPDVALRHQVSQMMTLEDFMYYAYQMLATETCSPKLLPSLTSQTTGISPNSSYFSNTDVQHTETNRHIHKDLPILTQSLVYHVPSRKKQRVEIERQIDHDVSYSSIPSSTVVQASAKVLHEQQVAISNKPLYSNGLQQVRMQGSAASNADLDMLSQPCRSPSSKEAKKLRGKWSLRNMRGGTAGSKGQVSTVPLAYYHAAAAPDALAPTNVLDMMSTQNFPQDTFLDCPMATENSPTWLDLGNGDIPHAGQLRSDKLAYFDPEIHSQHRQH